MHRWVSGGHLFRDWSCSSDLFYMMCFLPVSLFSIYRKCFLPSWIPGGIKLPFRLKPTMPFNPSASFPSDEGWPFAKYLGACGRMVAVNYVGEELWSYFNAPWEKRVDLAWQLMEIAEQLTNNDFEFALYLLDVSFDNFAVGPRDGKVIIVDAENVLVADKRLIRQNKPENWDVWYESKFDDCDKEACLSFSKEILCARVTVDHNYYAICQNLLSRHATWRGTSGGLLHDPPAEIAKDGRLEALLDECANPKKRYGRFQAAKELREYLAQLSNNVR
ncbi:divergent protein kinase domain 2A isoform X2 [Calonectris borealis]|uniref:divergent protein kinase domain 2A isoform X2 n=1 Tax=Calonectris borealis TaxID=1323832 RepID=UPI003F4BB013